MMENQFIYLFIYLFISSVPGPEGVKGCRVSFNIHRNF